jgi:hypothetical protein
MLNQTQHLREEPQEHGMVGPLDLLPGYLQHIAVVVVKSKVVHRKWDLGYFYLVKPLRDPSHTASFGSVLSSKHGLPVV